MTSQYDDIGLAYESMKKFPAAILERTTFQSIATPFLSSRQNFKVLDLACGTGYYTRLLQAWADGSIARILGIDLSPVMIEGARSSGSNAEGTGKIDFEVGDCVAPMNVEGGPFDIVTGAWLLNYASSAEEMTAMWRNISSNLTSASSADERGGVFIGITPHPARDLAAFAASFDPAHNPSAAADQSKYGVTVAYTARLASGEGYNTKITAHTQPAEISFENFHLSRDVYEASARAGGMKGELQWIEPRIPDSNEESLRVYGVEKEWWEEYRQRRHFGVMVVWKD